MKRLSTFLLFAILIQMGMSGCKSRKRKSDCTTYLTSYPKDVLEQVTENLASYEYMSLRVKASYTEGDNSSGFAMNVKMQKDSFVWVSVSAMIEVARAYVTPDSFKLIDRLHRKYYVGAISDLKKFTGQDMTLSQVQSLFVGNPLYAVDLFSQKNDALRNDFLEHQSEGITNRIQLSGCYRSMTTEFSSNTNTNRINIDYSNFTKEKGIGYMPNTVNVVAQGNGKKYDLLMEYSSVSSEPFQEISFTIPSKYEKGN